MKRKTISIKRKPFFAESITIRVTPEMKKRIRKHVKKNDHYENEGHFVRCAIIKTLREEE